MFFLFFAYSIELSFSFILLMLFCLVLRADLFAHNLRYLVTVLLCACFSGLTSPTLSEALYFFFFMIKLSLVYVVFCLE